VTLWDRLRGAAVFVAIASAAAGCSAISRNALPEGTALEPVQSVAGPIRFWGDTPPKNIDALVQQREAQLRAARGTPSRVINYLALSGGGSDGAYGAGMLVGWSEAGTRPQFDLVTGISTGALIAPFAFLGSAYDEQLKTVYTSFGQRDLAQRRAIPSVFADASVADNAPMAALIAQYIDVQMIAAIAREHRKGRRLLIGTTHLDAQRPVIWDIGEIASRDDPDAANLVHRVIMASASIPGVFPPVLIKVEQDGKSFDEMHVDGGVASQVFLFPTQFDPRSIDRQTGQSRTRRLYVIRNGRLNPEWQSVEPRLVTIAGRSISSLIKYQGRGDLNRMYLQSRSYKIDFNLASIPPSFTEKEKEPFDLTYMNALFETGYQEARAGYRWQKKPPDA
jgi:predicted acylesterase/phospholipase RssA